jgi:hypothetical protein
MVWILSFTAVEHGRDSECKRVKERKRGILYPFLYSKRGRNSPDFAREVWGVFMCHSWTQQPQRHNFSVAMPNFNLESDYCSSLANIESMMILT